MLVGSPGLVWNLVTGQCVKTKLATVPVKGIEPNRKRCSERHYEMYNRNKSVMKYRSLLYGIFPVYSHAQI